ncbi:MULTISPECIES: SIMPL domain-containing protein [unclassified Kribbella]|uniref:SIMPL domain-containing protein n=1 Tax=unclassified Kribbella TaxID=2644121 RepID=UPI0030185B52
MDTGVSVVGSGQVSAAPDVLRVSFSVEHVAPDVAAAVARVGEQTDAVIAALRGQGIEAADIATTTVNVYQEYREHGSAPGYRGSHMLTVTTKDLTGFGRLLNAAVDAGGNSLGLQGLQFDIEDKAELLTRARELAFRQARAKAEELAALAGYSLGSVTSISETHGHVPWVEQSKSAAAFDAAINITPGDTSIDVSLNVHFSWA